MMIPRSSTWPYVWRGIMPVIWKVKTGFKPNTFLETKSAVIDEAMDDSRISGEKCLCTSSNEKRTPAIGALNAAESPALAPHVIRSFSSVFTRFVSLENPFAAMAPSWMLGPSRPRDSPQPRPINPPASLATRTLHQFSSTSPMISPST